MELKELQRNWNELGKWDPLWSILTWQGKEGKQWKRAEFFETGKKEINGVMQYVDKLGLVQQRGRALDFGCGVGRLTQALASHFQEVVGIDIAPSMVERAKRYNRFGSRCAYYLNDVDNLRRFADREFDFIYTNIVLQHMRPDYAKSYLKEFLRLLRVQGVLIFQLPSAPRAVSQPTEAPSAEPSGPARVGGSVGIKRLIKKYVPELFWQWYVRRKYASTDSRMEMYGIPRSEVEELLVSNSGHIVDVVEDDAGGEGWAGFRYCAIKV